MRRTRIAVAALSLFCGACGSDDRAAQNAVDCTEWSRHQFSNIANFSGSASGWFQFADPTPGGIPDPDPNVMGSTDVPVTPLEGADHCGDSDHQGMRLRSIGHNFYGSGFGDWVHNKAGSRADGTGFAGISFWARAEPGSEKQFLFSADDGRTIVLTPDPVEPGAALPGMDLNGDGQLGPGDIVDGTSCLLPPPVELGDVVCYSGGVGGPTSSARVPGANECGNDFHVRVTLGETWQLVMIPWRDLVQWPCPNRLDESIDAADVAKFEIKLLQGAAYDFWVDDLAFYR